MAACELTIELDDPETPRTGGQPVSGTVIVTTTAPVKCDALELTSYWSTHGRGNVDQGDVDQCVVFQGNWDPQREYRYKFSLKTAIWPPTYYGTNLNVSHLVRARARIPWSSDPKTQIEFPVIATSAPEDLKPTVAETKKSNVVLGWIIGGIFLFILAAIFSIALLLLVPLLVIVGGCYWFFRKFLPRQLTGSIECSVEPQRLAAGETLNGSLRFVPKRNVTINGIQWKVTCTEKCVSGSGSNKTTHRHEVFTTSERLAEAGPLRVGLPQSFEFSFVVPERGPSSLKFSNNELLWSGELRIDIPKWPDWVQSFPLTVVPSGKLVLASPPTAGDERDALPGTRAGSGQSGRLPTAEEEAWFDEVVQQIIQARHEQNLLETVLAAVRQHVFVIRVDIDEQVERPPASAGRETGTWMFAEYRARDFDLCLLWPSPAEPPAAGTFNWSGAATIIGYDSELDSLLMRVTAVLGEPKGVSPGMAH